MHCHYDHNGFGFKWLTEDNQPSFARNFNFTPFIKSGDLVPKVKGPLRMCGNGYHFCRAGMIYYWKRIGHPDKLFLIQVSGPVYSEYPYPLLAEKYICQSFRFIKQIEIPRGHTNWGPTATRAILNDNGIRTLW